MPKKLTTEKFIEKAKIIHGSKYDYSLVETDGVYNKVKIICTTHGIFEQSPNAHLRGYNCKKCGHLKTNKKHTSTTDKFIKKSKEIHGDRYDYSLVEYKKAQIKVKIICPIHGVFEQTPTNHIHKTNRSGCLICGGRKKPTTEEFIIKAKEIHGDKYDYSLVKYKNSITRVKIICEKHGTFTQKPQKHLMGRGCPICGIITCSNKNRFTTEEFIIKAKEIHGDRYDYSLVEYEIANKKVKIICKKHGLFTQTPSKHLFCSRGCPICKASKGELKVFNYLKKHKISFESQYSFKDCKNIQILYFDFYLPEQNLCVEYDGIQHFKPIKQFGGNDGFKSNQLRDKIKNDYCNENDIKLLRIKYDEDVIKKLESYIYI